MSRKDFALNGTLADRVISLAHILGCPVRNAAGTRIGRVSDIVVRWDPGDEHPPVTGVFVKVRGALAVVQQADVTLSQTEIRVRSDARMEWRPVWGDDDVALARDVLDRQLVDTSGVQVVRQPTRISSTGHKAGSWRVSTWACCLLAEDSLPGAGPARRRIGSSTGHSCRRSRRDSRTRPRPWDSAPTIAAGTAGSGLQVGRSTSAERAPRRGSGGTPCRSELP